MKSMSPGCSGAVMWRRGVARPEADGARLVLEGGVEAGLEPGAALHRPRPTISGRRARSSPRFGCGRKRAPF